MDDSILGYALKYAAKGWPILPLHSIDKNGGCTCGQVCNSKGKHPRIPSGVKGASIDETTIRRWVKRWPDMNLGVATGHVSGIFALDVDPKNGGEYSFDELEVKYGRVPDDVFAVTGSGGKHFVFNYPGAIGRCSTNLYPGIDTRGDGGYIVVAPSNHTSGNQYSWDAEADPLEGAVLVDMPIWLSSKLSEKKTLVKPESANTVLLPNDEVKRIRIALGYIPADDRDPWLPVLMALHSTNAGNQAFGLSCEWASQSDKFDMADQRRVWDSFKSSGITIASLFAIAKQYGWVPPVSDRPPTPPLENYEDEFKSGPVVISKPNTESKPKNGLLTFKDIMARLSGTDYLVKPFLCTQSVGTLFGDSGTMKSFVAIDFGMSIALGVDYHGFNTKQGSVVFICGEGIGGIPKRLEAWRIAHNITKTDVPFFVTKLPVSLVNQMDVAGIADDIKKTCKAPALIIIDTLAANFGEGDESSNADMSKLITNVSIYLREMGACILFVHHVGHGDKARERGAYSLRANVDFRIQVERLTESSSITLRSLKVKDGPMFDPIAFKARVIPIPELFDSEGVQETSVVLDLDEYQDNAVVPKGNGALALTILNQECEARQKELGKRGSNALACVPIKTWHNLFNEQKPNTKT